MVLYAENAHNKLFFDETLERLVDWDYILEPQRSKNIISSVPLADAIKV